MSKTVVESSERLRTVLGVAPSGKSRFSHFFDDDPFRPQFGVAMVSCQFDRPARHGKATFRILVDAKERA